MDNAQLKDFCHKLPGVSSHKLGPPANILVCFVGDKEFTYVKTSEPEQCRFSICIKPNRFIELTDVPSIKPTRY